MFERWFYIHGGKTHGPLPIAEVVRRAMAGQLLAHEKLWPEEFDPQMAFAASATLDFAALARSAPPPVAPPPAPAKTGLPDWLSDVQPTAKPASPKPRTPPPALPDWLSDVQSTDRFIVRSRAPIAPPPPVAPKVPTVPPEARPQPTARPVVPQRPVATPALPSATPLPSPAPVKPIPAAVPSAPLAGKPVAPVAAPVPPGSAPAAPAPSREEIGYDADTGQILDAEKYRRWQKSQKEAAAQATESAGATIYEIYLMASAALQNWVDEDTTRPLIAQGSLETVRKDPGVQRLIQSYESHGQELANKLWQRLEFLVDNRRKFYASRA